MMWKIPDHEIATQLRKCICNIRQQTDSLIKCIIHRFTFSLALNGQLRIIHKLLCWPEKKIEHRYHMFPSFHSHINFTYYRVSAANKLF